MTSELQTKSEISKFFNDYTKLFDARDGTGISAYYHAPSISVRADASIHVYRSHQEVRDFFQAVADRYYDEGQRGSRFIDLEVKCLGVKSVLATLEWQVCDRRKHHSQMEPVVQPDPIPRLVADIGIDHSYMTSTLKVRFGSQD
jgi:hypothetical protein